MIRQKIHFYGRVQGVGFRYFMANKANYLGITGWVKNLWDGSVLAEVQGEIEDIKELIEFLEKDRYIRIDRMEREILPVIDGERSFYRSIY